jgi:predicted transposase YbfD/YdcC
MRLAVSEIAQKIIDAGADYHLAVKQNQGILYEQVCDGYAWRSAKKVD